MSPELPLFTLWEKLLGDLLDRTAKMPKAVRFTFAQRIDGLALDVVGLLAEARYTGGARKQGALREIDLRLVQLRLLLRVAHDRRYIDSGGYEHVVRHLDEAGRMVGGWRRATAPGNPGDPDGPARL